MKYFLILVMFVIGCATAQSPLTTPKYSQELRQSCKEFCGPPSYVLVWRNDKTFFCTCKGKSVVMGRLGTIYR
jgi:hypothetical protein